MDFGSGVLTAGLGEGFGGKDVFFVRMNGWDIPAPDGNDCMAMYAICTHILKIKSNWIGSNIRNGVRQAR